MFSDNFLLFWNFFGAFPKILRIFLCKFSVYFQFLLSVFREFESVKLYELGNWFSYGNIQRPANAYEDSFSTNQTLIQRSSLAPY